MGRESHNEDHSDEDSLLHEHKFEGLEKSTSKKSRRRGRWSAALIVVTTLALTLASLIIILLTLILQRQQQNHHHGKVSLNDTETFIQWKDCGNSSVEARSKGCAFDVLLTTWIHADCFDAELHEHYLQKYQFPFWRKGSMEDAISLEEVRQGDYIEIYTNLFYHFAHCGYAWEMILRAYRRGRPIEGELWAMGHTTHCVWHMVERPPMEQDRTILNVGFETCGQPYY